MSGGWARLEFSVEALCRLVYLLGALGNDDDDGSENITKKTNFAAFQTSENFIASIWNCSIRQMQATFPGVEFSRALSMFK